MLRKKVKNYNKKLSKNFMGNSLDKGISVV